MKLRKSSQEGVWNVYDGDDLMGVVSIETLETDFEYFTEEAFRRGERKANRQWSESLKGATKL